MQAGAYGILPGVMKRPGFLRGPMTWWDLLWSLAAVSFVSPFLFVALVQPRFGFPAATAIHVVLKIIVGAAAVVVFRWWSWRRWGIVERREPEWVLAGRTPWSRSPGPTPRGDSGRGVPGVGRAETRPHGRRGAVGGGGASA